MRRKNPLLSLSGILVSIVFITILVLSVWAKGGLAFNPGSLTGINRTGTSLAGFRSHADFENECSRCHQPLTTAQAPLCLECHITIQKQISTEEELHGKIQLVSRETGASKNRLPLVSSASATIPVERCHACHSDHQGRDFSPAHAALEYFEHDITGFSLSKHQVDYEFAPLECETCHGVQPGRSGDINASCFNCHVDREFARMNAHRDEFGNSCIDCHDGIDRMVDFDHQKTDFPLAGVHLDLECTQCHVQAPDLVRFEGISSSCADCHQEPAMHAGLFTSACEDCHNPEAWSPAFLEGASFDHTLQTHFSLARHQQDYDGSSIECNNCHVTSLANMTTETCIECHRLHDAPFMESHLVQFGTGCLDCHDGIDRMRDFDHNQVFILDGMHAQINCQSCHGAPPELVRFTGTPTACAECHLEPEIHAGVFGLECQSCHHTDAWSPAMLQSHSFPLDHGGQGPVACQMCHPATYVEYTCYECHDHDPQEIRSEHLEEGISADELPNCVRCHPTGLEHEAEGRGDD